MITGLHDSIKIDEYHESDGLSSSGIKLLIDCPRKFYNRYVNPAAKKGEYKKECLVRGQAFHSLFLEPQTFETQYYITDRVRRNTKAYTELEQAAAEMNKEILFKDDLKELQDMVKSLQNVPVANKAIRDGKAEISGFWIDDDSGELLRCRPDYLTNDFILDLKTTRDASPSSFGRDVIKYNYHVQAAFYLDGIKKITGKDDMQFIFLAVEGAPDFVAEWYVLDDELLELGRQLYKAALKLYQKCKSENNWPTYCSALSDHQLCLPSYAYDKLTQLEKMVQK